LGVEPPPKKFRPSLRIRSGRLLRLLTLDGFATAPLWLQLVLIFMVSAVLVFLFTPLTGDLSYCYTLFADPGTYGEAVGFRQLFFGFFVLILGLILVSLIISVLTAALEELIERVRSGTRPYRKKGHILIIHRNAKLPFMLDEMNVKYAGLGQALDVVVLLGDAKQVEEFWSGLEITNWPHLNIYLRLGDMLTYETYERVSILSAAGILLLQDEAQEDTYLADSQNLKVLAMLTNEGEFWAHLEERHVEKRPVKCAVELSRAVKSHEIARQLASRGPESLFSVMSPVDVVATVLSRAIIDFAYYRIYLELFSFEHRSIYFVDPRRFAAQGLRAGLKFEELGLRFTTGILIGYSYATEGGLDVVLAPLGRALQEGEWLLLIAPNEADITFEGAAPPPARAAHAVSVPSVIRQRRLCLVGAERRFDRLGDFLDEASQEWYRQNQIVLAEPEEYFAPEFIERLRAGGYDKVIINLPDDLAFRFALYLRGLLGDEDPLVQNIITVLNDPVTDALLHRRGGHRDIILSDKLAAKYLTQLTFQKNLEKVYDELISCKNAEVKLLDVGVHIPRAALTNKQAVKQLLLAHGLIYLGTVNMERECGFDAADFAEASQIVVLGPAPAE
jgi:hypothetical protein